jgi:hypothetical protein
MRALEVGNELAPIAEKAFDGIVEPAARDVRACGDPSWTRGIPR